MTAHAPIRAIFWDNDGVLVETEHLYFQATRDVLASVDIPLSEAQYEQFFLVESRGAWHLAAERGFTPDEIAELRRRRHARYTELVSDGESRVIAGVHQALARLHGSVAMGIVTSSYRDHFEAIHRTSGLLDYFDFVITGSDVSRTKPDPEPYLKAVARSGVDPASCVAVEDSMRGLAAARAAGVRCVVIPGVLARTAEFTGAEAVLGSVGDVADWLHHHAGAGGARERT